VRILRKIIREFQQSWQWYGVPFVSTPDSKLKIIADEIILRPWDKFIDIGCGDGRVVDALDKKYPWSICAWYESSSYPYSLALQRKEKQWWNYELYKQDIFTADISTANIIFIYMVPYMLQKLTKKIQNECKLWTKIYVQSHPIKNWQADRVVSLSEKNNLYIYTLKK